MNCDHCGNLLPHRKPSILKRSIRHYCGIACSGKYNGGGPPIHGHSNSPTYTSWYAMKRRCIYPKQDSYPYYGGRGITVCERWMTFENFLADMGVRPSKNHSVDRINANGNYEPSNCRWATAKEQAGHKKNNLVLTLDGKSMILTDWAEKYGIPIPTLKGRLRRGVPLRDALTMPRGNGPNAGVPYKQGVV